MSSLEVQWCQILINTNWAANNVSLVQLSGFTIAPCCEDKFTCINTFSSHYFRNGSIYLLFTVWKNGTVFIKLWCFFSNLTKMQGREVKLFGNGLWQVITNHRNQSASGNFSEWKDKLDGEHFKSSSLKHNPISFV